MESECALDRSRFDGDEDALSFKKVVETLADMGILGLHGALCPSRAPS